MKEKQLMKGAAFMLLAATAIPPAHAQLKTNAGVQYLLSQSKDMSQDFLDLSNTYFFADSLVSFDTSTGKGTVQWKRQQLMPRQAFNANTYLHQPLQSLDFPETAYDNNPQLTFTVEPVSERTLRIHMLTSPIVPKEDADDPMLIGKPADGRSFWKAEKTDKGTLYTSRYGSLLIENYPWRLVLKDAAGQLDEYFRGVRRIFDLPLAPQGTPFEEAVWQALLTIPYGETRSYADIARQTGRPSACRPVGRANGHNPISIIIPCHRVIGANKKLTGYTGGLSIKQYLLELEQGATSSFLPLPEEQHMSRDLSSTC